MHRADWGLAGPRCDGWCTLCVDLCALLILNTQGLRLFYIELSNDDFAQLVARYDPTNCGQIDYTAFVTSLVPPSYSADWAANGAAAPRPLSASAAARSARAAVTHDLTLGEFESMLADRLQHATGCFGDTAPSSAHKVRPASAASVRATDPRAASNSRLGAALTLAASASAIACPRRPMRLGAACCFRVGPEEASV